MRKTVRLKETASEFTFECNYMSCVHQTSADNTVRVLFLSVWIFLSRFCPWSVCPTKQGPDRAVRTFVVLVRRHRIRDPIRKPIQVKEQTIIVFPKSSGPPLREVISQTINAGDRILEGRESPNPADMRDGRIVDYTLNKRLFPVPLFPNHQKLPTNDDIRYARISVPVRIISAISGLINQASNVQHALAIRTAMY